MRIIFVRHGHPDYQKDCLTELGHKHAEAVAKRLCDENIYHIYSSSCGRAVETAEYIAKVHDLEVEQLDFMREIAWGNKEYKPIPHNGHPWKTSHSMIAEGARIMDENWKDNKYFSENFVDSEVERVGKDFDSFLAELGYEREGDFYRVRENNENNIVLASHAGSSSAVLARIFNLPFPFICATIEPKFTAVTVVEISGENGSMVSPRFEIVNDGRHIFGIEAKNVIDN